MIDVSDEATGLPSLAEVDPDDSFLALSWEIGKEGLITLNADDIAVRYLSVRGLVLDEDGEPAWQQAHIAIPTDALRSLLEKWLEQLDDESTT